MEPGFLDIVRFQAGGFAFALEARHVVAMRAGPYPGMVTVEDFLRLPTRSEGRRRWLTLRTPAGGEICLEVGEPVQLCPLPVERIFPLPEMVAARISLNAIVAIAQDPDGMILLVDPFWSIRRLDAS